MTTRDKAVLLERVSHYEGTEVGDFWEKIIEMYLYDKDYMTDEFHCQLGVELEIHYQDAKDLIDDGDLEVPEEIREALK